MPNIGLDLNSDLVVNVNNELSINISPDSGNTLTKRNNGIYAAAPDGVPGNPGSSYPNGNWEGITITSGKVSMTNIVHHMYTSTDAQGQNLTNFRSSQDLIYPGDMYRMQMGSMYAYYLVLTVLNNGKSIGSFVVLGVW